MRFEIVGAYLYEGARTETAERQNLFIRSAINRYYYAAFHVKIEMYKCLHKDHGINLMGKGGKAKHHGIRREHKKNILRKISSEDQSTMMKGHLDAFSTLLQEAYGYRRVADYEPDTDVTLDTTRTNKIMFKSATQNECMEIDFEEVREWPEEARQRSQEIIRIVENQLPRDPAS